jgi:hypothetical protein
MLFCIRLRLRAAVFQIVASGIQILVDVDILELRLEVLDHLVGDPETAEELFESSAADRLTARRTVARVRRARDAEAAGARAASEAGVRAAA